MSLATSAKEETWIAPVAYAYDEHFNLFWYSERTALHSQHIVLNQAVAVAIFNSQAPSEEADGLQIAGIASEVGPIELSSVADLYFRQSFPDEATRARWSKPAECFIGDAPLRFYKIRPIAAYKCDTEYTSADRRLAVNLLVD